MLLLQVVPRFRHRVSYSVNQAPKKSRLGRGGRRVDVGKNVGEHAHLRRNKLGALVLTLTLSNRAYNNQGLGLDSIKQRKYQQAHVRK